MPGLLVAVGLKSKLSMTAIVKVNKQACRIWLSKTEFLTSEHTVSPICGRIVIHLICCKCCPSLEIWTGDDVAAVTSEDEEDDCISAPSCPGIQLHHRLPQEVGGEDVGGRC